MAPINRDADEERLARIEQMLEDLRRDIARLSDEGQRIRQDAIVAREKAAQTRAELHRAIIESREKAAQAQTDVHRTITASRKQRRRASKKS